MGRALQGCAFYLCFRLKVRGENSTALALFISSSTDPGVFSQRKKIPQCGLVKTGKANSFGATPKPFVAVRRDSATDRSYLQP